MIKQPRDDDGNSLFSSAVEIVRTLGSADENADWLNEKSVKELEDERKQKNHLMPAQNVVDGTAIVDDAKARIEVIEMTISVPLNGKK